VTSWLVASSVAQLLPDDGSLEGFWASDIWLMRACPLGVGHGIFRFGGLTPQLKIFA
jgi:hypothetical protein